MLSLRVVANINMRRDIEASKSYQASLDVSENERNWTALCDTQRLTCIGLDKRVCCRLELRTSIATMRFSIYLPQLRKGRRCATAAAAALAAELEESNQQYGLFVLKC